jgi:hypothetical protein
LHADFHEGHSTVGEWQGRGRGTAWERYGMCESALSVISLVISFVSIITATY